MVPSATAPRQELTPQAGATRAADPSDLAGRSVLVVGINYWPEPTGIAPYTTGMAEYLAEQGALVKVLTGIPHYPTWRVADGYGRRLLSREWRRGVEVVRLRHSVPRQMTALRRGLYEATFLAHAALRGLSEQPDLVVAVTPALGGALAAATVACRAGCPLVVVVQDLMAKASGQSGITGGGRVTRVTSRLEGAALRRATHVAVVSDSFRSAVEAYGISTDRIEVLRNWTRITALPLSRMEARALLGWPERGFVAVHTGNMGFKQGLGNVLEAAGLLQGSAIDILLVGDGSQRRALERDAAGLNNLRVSGLVSDALYPAVLAAADVLLVNERPSVGDMSLPSKITSYLAAGKAIVAAVAATGASREELERTGGAALIIPPGDPRALAYALLTLAERTPQLESMGRAAAAYADRHLSPDPVLQGLSDLILRASQRLDRGSREITSI